MMFESPSYFILGDRALCDGFEAVFGQTDSLSYALLVGFQNGCAETRNIQTRNTTVAVCIDDSGVEKFPRRHLVGVAEAVTDISFVVFIQQRTPSYRMGKIFSMWSTVALLGESLGALLTGALIAHAAIVPRVPMCGADTLAMTVFGLITSRVPAGSTVRSAGVLL